jgi:hypothetical protein
MLCTGWEISMSPRTHVCYWLFDATCSDPKQHGYVGVTGSLAQRLANHRFKEEILPRNFRCEILVSGTRAECLEYELNLRPDFNVGWNKDRGGINGHLGHRGRKHSNATLKRIRVAALKRFSNPKELRKLSASITKAFKDPQKRANLSAALRGHDVSVKTRQKISKSLTGHVRSAQSRAKQSASAKGKPKSEEWKRKMSEIAKRRYADPAERERMSQIVKKALTHRP